MGLFRIQSDLQFRVSNHGEPRASPWRARKEDASNGGRGSGRAVNRAHGFHRLSPHLVKEEHGDIPGGPAVKNPPSDAGATLGWGDPRRGEGLPAPVSWPGESHGLYGAGGRKESGTTERLSP